MGKKIDVLGRVCGQLTVIDFDRTINGACYWLCKCSCGKIISTRGDSLRNGDTASCGCKICYNRGGQIKHGYLSSLFENRMRTKTYRCWADIKNRCLNPNVKGYEYYGGRGITVCERWKNSFEAFLEDMGEPPTSEHSIDRINNNGNYAPENCKWSTKYEQVHNRRPRNKQPEPLELCI